MFIKAIIFIIIGLVVLGAIQGIREQIALSKIKIPEFPETNRDGMSLMKTVEFTLSGVNHVHDGCDPQKIITPMLKGQWLTLKADPKNKHDNTAVKVLYNGKYIGWLPASNASLSENDAKNMIFKRLMHDMEVIARFDTITTVQIGGWDLDESDPKLNEHEFNSAVITCAIYNLPNGRYPKK